MSKEGQKSLILKPTRGFGGRGVFKVETKEQYLKEEKNIKEEYCVTPFFEHICELRFIIFKRKVEIMHLKYNSETNIIRPKLKKEEKPKITLSAIRKMKNEAIKVAEIMKYDFIAVDYLVAKD